MTAAGSKLLQKLVILYARAKSHELRLKFGFSYKVIAVAGQKGDLQLPARVGVASPGGCLTHRGFGLCTPEGFLPFLMGRAESANCKALNARGEEITLVT